MKRVIAVILSGLFIFDSGLLLADSLSTAKLHLDWLDQKIDPAKDFFAYANGGWQKKNAIPAAYPSWDNFYIVEEQNQQRIKSLLEQASQATHYPPDSIEQKMGDFYYSGMNKKAIEAAGIQPLKQEFARIQAIKNNADLQQMIIHLQMIGVNTVFHFGQMQDFKQSRQVIGVAAQGGLGLPDRDYYLKTEKKFQQIRCDYVSHITRMFHLLGDDNVLARAEAKKVMEIETTLATASTPRIVMRDPHAIYHRKNCTQLEQITPHFSWQHYFKEIGHPEIQSINLATPDFFIRLDAQLTQLSLADWKIYLRWQLIHSFASLLSAPWVREDFYLTSLLTGTQKPLARWRQVVEVENMALGFAIGKQYIDKYFSFAAKQQVEQMTHQIRTALAQDLQKIDWMTPATRKAALSKLKMMRQRIGYPDKWWDYSALIIDRGPYVLNVMRANEFIIRRELNKIGKPVDEEEWEMTPQTVNAYYDPSSNRLNIPAGILQPPFFDPNAPAALNYGAIGFVIGHEMTHGFDDQGAQFDGRGNLNNWWSKEDLKKFQLTTHQMANQFSQYKINGDVHLQGELVTGEAIADLGGLILAYRAFHASTDYLVAKTIAGFTPDQQFFLSAAHVWANNIRPEEAHRLVLVDPHPPARYRVNGTFADISQFRLAYGLANNSLMVNEQRPVIW